MFGDLFLYAANRATQGAVDTVARRASWGGYAVFLMLVGTVFGLIVLFWSLEARYGAMAAGVGITASCFIVGLVCMMMPKLLDRLEAKAKKAEPASTVTAVQEEVAEAVDYFGPIRVVGSAFVLGLGLARNIKRQ